MNSNLTDSSGSNCEALKAIGIYAALMLTFSFIANVTLIFAYIRHKEVRTPLNLLQVILAVLNLVASCIEFPTLMVNGFSCGFVIGRVGCVLTGFVMYYVGCTGMYMIMIISFERFWVLNKPTQSRILSFKACGIAVCMASMLSFVWSISPTIGWSYYSIEGFGVGCSVEWADHSANVVSYNITIFVTVFLGPVAVLLFTNYKLIHIMRDSRKRMAKNMTTDQLKKKFAKERSLTALTVILIGLFLLSWLPYGIVAMYAVFGKAIVSPMWSTLPSLLAKTSLVWPSLWTCIANRDIRKRILFWKYNNTVEPTSFHSTMNKTTKA